jgi:hypothetical protein
MEDRDMTAREARELAAASDARSRIYQGVSAAIRAAATGGKFYCLYGTDGEHMSDDEIRLLHDLGFSISWNRAILGYEVSWSPKE